MGLLADKLNLLGIISGAIDAIKPSAGHAIMLEISETITVLIGGRLLRANVKTFSVPTRLDCLYSLTIGKAMGK
jgi:hypothetical protein